MQIAARVLRLLALGLWLGSIVFFGFVVAPTAAHVFGTTGNFANFIGHAIFQLHSIGLWCGVAIFVALRMLYQRAYKSVAQAALTFVMILLTYLSTTLILKPMEHDRALAGGDITILLPDSPIRQDFDTRHAWSTRVESGVLLCGIALAGLIGMEDSSARTVNEPRKVFDLSSDA